MGTGESEEATVGRVLLSELTSLHWQLRGFTATPRIYILFGRRGHMTAAGECSEGLSAFTWHWQAARRSNTAERKYSLFPWHHPARNRGKWREERGHSWWQPQYHLLLTNSSCCFTYKLALLWTRVVAVRLLSQHSSEIRDWNIMLNHSTQTCIESFSRKMHLFTLFA